MTDNDKIKAPSHLRPETKQWWSQVMEDFDLESHHVKLLTLAGEAWDRCQEAREAVEKDGPYLPNRFGELKSHPGISVERDSRLAFARLIRELALDVCEPGENRPEPIRGNAGRKIGC